MEQDVYVGKGRRVYNPSGNTTRISTGCEDTNILQKLKKQHEQGTVQRQFESHAGEIISLVDNEPEVEDTKNANGKRGHSSLKSPIKAGGARQVKSEEAVRANIPEERINFEASLTDESPVASASQIAVPAAAKARPAPSASVEPAGEDDELERLEDEARKVAEEIEEAERLARLKRKHETLQTRIEAARARRAQS
jgi:hypothetical protein